MAKSSKRKGRRARGTGTIFKSEARKVWIGRKTVGKNAKGKPVRVEVWGDTQAEVVKKLAAAVPPGPETTIGQWADRWMASIDVRKATVHVYGKSVRLYITPALGPIKVTDLTPSRVEAFGVGLVKDGLQPTTARLAVSHLRTMLMAAVRDGLIPVNPCTTAKKVQSKGEVKKLKPFTLPELVRIMGHAPKYSAGGLVSLLAACGCRVGEGMGLDVTDFDPATGLLSISRTYDARHGVGPPKSRHSVRTIRVPVNVVPVLKNAIGMRTAGPLFASSPGNRHVLTSVRDAWRRTCRDLGIEFRKVHQLRHSVATVLVSKGVPLGDVAKFLGDTVETVVKTYLHPAGTDPTDTLDTLYGGVQDGEQVGKVG